MQGKIGDFDPTIEFVEPQGEALSSPFTLRAHHDLDGGITGLVLVRDHEPIAYLAAKSKADLKRIVDSFGP